MGVLVAVRLALIESYIHIYLGASASFRVSNVFASSEGGEGGGGVTESTSPIYREYWRTKNKRHEYYYLLVWKPGLRENDLPSKRLATKYEKGTRSSIIYVLSPSIGQVILAFVLRILLPFLLSRKTPAADHVCMQCISRIEDDAQNKKKNKKNEEKKK